MITVEKVFVFGYNYRTIQPAQQDQLKVGPDTFSKIIHQCPQEAVPSLTLISTCNRLECYGFGDSQIAKRSFYAAIDHATCMKENLMEKNGEDAVEYIFNVAAGLNSQLVGDLEILGQFKTAFRRSKQEGRLSGYMERLSNLAVKAAKQIRSNTQLTSGTTSLSYASIQLLRELRLKGSDNILVIGAGKFGKSLGRNLRKYFPENQLYFCNRTQSKSEALAEELSCHTVSYGDLIKRADEFDVLISAIGDTGFKLSPEHLDIRKDKILIDLSVPSFFDRQLSEAEGIQLFNIQDASCIVNRSLERRESSIPLAKNILFKHIHEFVEWSRIYAKSGYIKEWKAKVEEISEACPHFHTMSHEKQNSILKKSVGRFVHYLKKKTTTLEENQPVLNHFIKNEHPSPCLLRCEQEGRPTIHCKLCLRN